MSEVRRTNQAKWKQIVARFKASSKGGAPGQWSARKAQLATQAYKSSGGGYVGPKSSNNSLSKWTKQDWTTKSGKPSTQGSSATGERYLPRKAIESMSSQDYARTTEAKRQGRAQGRQFVSQPSDIASKTRKFRT
jgi:hypothetical protein